MWVRVATFEGGDTEKLKKLNEERMSSGEMTPPEGMSGVLLLADNDANKRKFFAFFDSKEAIEAAEPRFESMGDEVPEDIRGKRTSVHYYEVPVYEGNIEGATAARVSLLEGPPDSIDASLEQTRGDALPKVRSIQGNVGAIGLTDRENGRVSMITLWDSPASLKASEQEAQQLREQSAELGGAKISNVARYEVAGAQTSAGART